jgi:hypothetical protein
MGGGVLKSHDKPILILISIVSSVFGSAPATPPRSH